MELAAIGAEKPRAAVSSYVRNLVFRGSGLSLQFDPFCRKRTLEFPGPEFRIPNEKRYGVLTISK